IYDAPNVWHFRFNGEYPEKLVQGRERTYFEYFWNVFAADETHSIPEAERKAYTAAYARPGRMRAAWAYFASWPQLATEFAPLSKTKLTMPVLSIGGEKSLGNQLGANEIGGRQCQGHRSSKHWPLDYRRKAKRNH